MDRGQPRALNAEKVHNMVNVFSATHNMGAARIVVERNTSVCNEWGQTHEIDNFFLDGSLFASAGCENSTSIIVALVFRQADHIEKLVQTNAI